MAKRRPFHHGNLRQALVDAAIELLDSQDVAGTTLRAVAAFAGVSHAAPANHFKDRRALLTEVATIEFSRLRASIQNALSERGLTDKERISVFSEAVVRYALKHPNRYELLWRKELVDHEDPGLLSVMDSIYDSLCAEIRSATQNTAFDVHTFAVSIWSMTHGYVALRLSGMFEEFEDEVRHEPRFQAMKTLLLGSITRPGE